MKRRLYKIGLFILFICLFLLVYEKQEFQAATGYTEYGHSWETPSKCGTCGGDHVATISKNCSDCSGTGKYYRCVANLSHYQSQTQISYCLTCSNAVAYLSCETCGGDGKVTSSGACSNCYASGTYKGKNTRCANDGCSKSSYGAWSDYPNGVCYKVAKTVKVTFNKNDGTGATVTQTFIYDVSNQKFGYNTDGTAKWETSGQFGAWDNDGYKLLGWSHSSTTTTASYTPYSGVANTWIDANSPSVTLYAVWDSCAHDSWTVTEYFMGIPVKRACSTCGLEQVSTWFTAVEGVSGYSTDPAWHGYDAALGGISWLYDDTGNVTYMGVWHNIGTEVTISVNMEESDDYSYSCLTNGNAHTTEKAYTYTKNSSATWTANVWKTLYWNGLAVGREKSCSICGDETEYAVWIQTNGYDVTPNNPNFTQFAQSGTVQLYFYPSDETASFTVSGEEGYTYYWTQGDVNYTDTISFSMESARSITANRTKNAYTVTYNVNGGTFLDGTTADKTIVLDYGSEVPLDIICEKEGYKFVGWAMQAEADKPLSYLEMPASDITLYPMYSLPVSDVKEANLIVWSKSDTSTYKTYPMEIIDTTIRGYTYALEGIDITAGLSYSFTDEIRWKIVIYDNAGNKTEIYPTDDPGPVIPVKYLQTVVHYIWDQQLNDWEYLTSVDTLVVEGENFTPQYLSESDESFPVGYHASSIDSSYVVTGAKTSNAYYMPNEYKLYFDANAGTCNTEYKTVYYNYFYGELPGAEDTMRPGHDFLGWFTEESSGTEIESSDIYTKTEDSTVYAHWKIHSHDVKYDYASNSGTSADTSSKTLTYGAKIDLDVNANKQGWDHIGWNTNPEAIVSMTSSWYCDDCKETHYISSMPDHEVTLFAIYKKDMTATFVDPNPETETKKDVTIYNKAESAEIIIPENIEIEGWSSDGWSTSTESEEAVEFSAGSTYEMTDNITFYGIHTKSISLSYDTNGSAQVYEAQSGTRYYNAAGTYKNPVFIVLEGPTLDNHSFVNWIISEGTVEDANGAQLTQCAQGNSITLLSDTTLKSLWDQYPEIEAYDRYFTLEEAKEGKITEIELLEKVKGTDLEDGTLVNGSGVIVLNYNATIFTDITTDQKVEITYQASDSYGNTTTKTVTIVVTDTTARKSTRKKYVRFISSRFFEDSSGNLIPSTQGGLEDTSIWRTNAEYRTLLQETLEKIIERTKEGLP